MRGGSDEPVLNELDDRGVVHGDVRDVVLARERRDDHVRHAEAKLGGESVFCRRVRAFGAGIAREQVAVESRRSSAGHAGVVAVGIDGDRGDVRDGAE